MTPQIKLIVDSGSTKTEWCLLREDGSTIFTSQGMSPYFATVEQIEHILRTEVVTRFQNVEINQIYFYGTGCKSEANKMLIKKVFHKVFPNVFVFVENDLFGAARALCGKDAGIACILGTGSNSCYFDGNIIVKNNPGLGYVLGDEGSGAVLGKKVIQHYLYDIFDEDMRARFDARFVTTPQEILDNVYKKPLPNRYLASFAIFLAENRGNYMIENIIEDGLNEFFFTHVIRYGESAEYPVHFTGSVAFGFKDEIEKLCNGYELECGNIYKSPMEGLINYHK